MENETQLIVRRGGNQNILSISNNPVFGGVGEQRLITNAFPNQLSLDNTSFILYNFAGQSQNVFCNSIQVDTPAPGQTRFNFSTVFAFDFRVSRGGYFVFGDQKEYYIDLYPLESISQNFNFQDVGTFAPLGDFTREFRVPASDRNLEVFGLLDSFTFSDSANVYGTKIPAEIRVNTLPIIRGHLRVIKTFKKNDVLGDIQLSFYGEAPDLFRAIGDKLLGDISILSDLNYLIDYTNVITPPNPELVYGLVDRGQMWDNTGAGRPITNSEQPIYPADLTPFINAWTLLFWIVRDAGFTLSATPLETILSGYFCPWINSKNIITIEGVANYYFAAGYIASTSVAGDTFFDFPELVNNGGAYSSAFGYFEAPVEGFYGFRFWANVIPVGSFGANTGGVKFYRYASGAAAITGDVVVNYEIAISGFDQNNGIRQRVLITTDPIYMDQGQRMEPFTEFNGTPLFLGDANNNPLNGTGWELFSYYRNWGDTFNAPANAPNVKQLDFVKDVLAMHGAILIPSRTIPNEVTLFPINDYIATGDDLNWTAKMDITKDITLSPTTDIQKKNFLWSYKNGGDFASKLYTDNGRTYGQYQILNGYSISNGAPVNEFVSGNLNVKLTAESTPSSYVNGSTIPIPKFINDKGAFVAPNLRFLFLADIARLPIFDDSINAVSVGDINIFNHYSSVDASVGDYDLNFNPETPLHAITTNPFRNLFNEYWRDYLNGLYSPEARILEAFFALDLTDILSFKYNDRIFIKDAYWRILEISDYKVGLSESTKVRLIKLVDPAPDCQLIPTTVVINEDMTQAVEFEDLAGDPAAATEACCVRYGYTWEPSLNQCLSYGTPIIGDPDGGSQGFRMMGAGQNGTPSNVLAVTSNTAISADNTMSVFAGQNISIEKGNQNTLAVGERLKIEGANRGTVVLGRNVLTNTMGLHYGGGDRVSNKEGNQQGGLMIFANAANFNASGNLLELVLGNDVVTRLDIPDETAMACSYILHASDAVGLFIYETGSFYLEKVGVTSASTPVIVSSDNSGSALTLAFSIDTATNTAQHRFKVTAGGAGFPYTAVRVVLTINYNQIR